MIIIQFIRFIFTTFYLPLIYTLLFSNLTAQNFIYPKALDSKKTCTVRTHVGFHVRNHMAVISGVSFLVDCLQLCMKNQKCMSVNYISRSFVLMREPAADLFSSGQCWLSASTIPNFQRLHQIDQSIYASFDCRAEESNYVESPNIFHGIAPRQCGVLAFQHPQKFFGRRNRVIGGSKAPLHSQPWLGFVVYEWKHVCGISLITNNVLESITLFAVTAAHCFYDFTRTHRRPRSSMGFVFGVHDQRFPSAHVAFRMAENICIHPSYDPAKYGSDLAVVKFSEPVRLNDYVRPICLPEVGPIVDPPTGTACSICGFGQEGNSDDDELVYSDVPNCFTAKLMTTGFFDKVPRCLAQECPLAYYKSDTGRFKYKGAGKGDSGGPVSCPINNQYTLFGIVSSYSSDPYDEHIIFNIYTRLPYFRKWIKQTIMPEDKTESGLSIESTDSTCCRGSCFPICKLCNNNFKLSG